MSGFTQGDYLSVLRGRQKPQIDPYEEDITLFLLDFYPYDESRLKRIYPDDEEDEPSEPEFDEDGRIIMKKKKRSNNFIVRVFGTVERESKLFNRAKDHYSISLDIKDFNPYFFVKIPDHWESMHLEQFIEQLKHEASTDPEARFNYSRALIKHKMIEGKPFYGFTANDKFKYVKLVFDNSSGFNNYRNLIARLQKNSPDYWEKHQLFESNIEPMLRLVHIQDITPSGWIKIPKGKARMAEKQTSDCQLHFEVSFKDLVPLNEKVDIPPMICASYDIEADSSHGDFPIANKSYQKLAQDIVTQYLKLPQANNHYLRGVIYKWITLAFHPYFDNNNINRIVTKDNLKPDQESVAYLAQLVYDLGDQYRSSLQDIIREGHDPAAFREGILDRYASQLHLHLELNLPEPDIENLTAGNYRLLAEQLLREVNRMVSCHKRCFLENPLECIKFWINLAFDEYYDNHEINRVYTLDETHPNLQTLYNLVPQILAICQECYAELNKPKIKAKTVAKIGPKKFMLEPPEKGQSKLSQCSFIKKKSNKIAELKRKKAEAEGIDLEAEEAKKKKTELEATQRQKESKISGTRKYNGKDGPEIDAFYRGRYIKEKPQPDPDDPEQKPVKIGRDFFVTWIYELFDQHLPEVIGDPIIQIGTTFKRYGEKELFLKHIITLKGCSKFTNEELIDDENRDIYISKAKDAISAAKKLNIESDLYPIIEQKAKDAEQNGIKNPKIPELDQLNQMIYVARRDRQLGQDNSVVRVECYNTEKEVLLAWRRLIKDTDPDVLTGYNIFGFDFKYLWDRAEVLGVLEEFRDLGRIRMYPENLVEKKLVSSGLGDNLLYYIPMTGRVLVDLLKVVQSGGYRLPIYKLDFVCNHFLNKRKNDLPPQKIFIYQKGSDTDRATIARYCLIDCILCNRLIDKLEILTNNIGMSRVCNVPLSYLFLRGQGIKIFSFLSKICRAEGYLIKTKDRNDAKDQEGYEGAIVLDPEKGIYFEASVVADFNSLYPSCMIAWNLSHDSYIEIGGQYDNLPEDQYYDVHYDLYRMENIPGRKAKRKVKYGVKTCRFYQPPDGTKSLVPRVLESLLKARKQTRKEQKKFTKGSFEWNVKEGLQLAYKVTANSVYGQIGAPTSSVFLKDIAACTTACGRGLIYKSKNFFEEHYEGAKTIYGDTDSVFIKFHTRNIRGETLHGLDSIYKSIELCMEGSLGISRTLPRPHNLEFEKAIWPFMLLSKKRYHGHYYTIYGKPKFYPNSMGIVLKRRDNAKIVKHIFGGVIDIIMEEHDIQKAMKYCQDESKKLLEGKFTMDYFTITKTLKSYYKNPDQIAHNVLAQRIAERDPGNKPQSNDRMQFAYIKVPEPKKGEKVLQGNRIETPEYIEDNKLQLDYRFYLTNQVMKPVTQIFELVMDEKELSGLFMDALMEYDRKMSGIQRISKWVSPNSAEYKRRIDSMINDVLKQIHDEDDDDSPIKIEAGDEFLFD